VDKDSIIACSWACGITGDIVLFCVLVADQNIAWKYGCYLLAMTEIIRLLMFSDVACSLLSWEPNETGKYVVGGGGGDSVLLTMLVHVV
jgi:hypothetical protein